MTLRGSAATELIATGGTDVGRGHPAPDYVDLGMPTRRPADLCALFQVFQLVANDVPGHDHGLKP